MTRTFPRWLLGALLLALALPVRAETWRVDLIVFRYLGASEETGRPAAPAPAAGVLELDDANALSAAGITVLPEADFRLADHWARLRASSQFRPVARLAWTQNDPPAERGPRLRLRGGARFTPPDAVAAREVHEIDGSLSLRLSRFLHLDANLTYTDPTSGLSWALNETRRMRSDELHHLDSPRLGIVARVVKWGP